MSRHVLTPSCTRLPLQFVICIHSLAFAIVDRFNLDDTAIPRDSALGALPNTSHHGRAAVHGLSCQRLPG